MAGLSREEERHFKKQTDRRDFNNNAKRKNSFGKNKELHTSAIPTAAVVAPSPSPTTPTSNTSSFSSGSNPALPSLRQTPEHISLNSFNAQEVAAFFKNSWNEAFDKYYDHNYHGSDKPEMYTSEKAWTKLGHTGQAWVQNKGHLVFMANGNDFLTELRKSSTVANVQQPATANMKRTASQRRSKGFGKKDASLDS